MSRRRSAGVFGESTTWAVSGLLALASVCATPGRVAAQAPADGDGQALYERECLACHMRDGRGVPGMAPALVGSPWIVGSPDTLAGFVLTGGFGPEVLMAPFDYLSDAELAAILTYVRRTFGGGASPVDAALVGDARARTREIDSHSPNAK